MTTSQTIAPPTLPSVKISSPISKKNLSHFRTHFSKNLSHLDLHHLVPPILPKERTWLQMRQVRQVRQVRQNVGAAPQCPIHCALLGS
jgi:hypothetical protein